MQRPLAHGYWFGGQVRAGMDTERSRLTFSSVPGPDLYTDGFLPEQVLLDSSSSFPQSLSPSQSQRIGMQRLF